MTEVKYGITAKTDGTYRVEPTRGTTGWIVFKADYTVSHQQYSFAQEVKGEALAPYIEALRAYRGEAAPTATYSLSEVVKGAPSVGFSQMTDDQVLEDVRARTGTPIVGGMGRYILRQLGRYGNDPRNTRIWTDAELSQLVQDAWEVNANRE